MSRTLQYEIDGGFSDTTSFKFTVRLARIFLGRCDYIPTIGVGLPGIVDCPCCFYHGMELDFGVSNGMNDPRDPMQFDAFENGTTTRNTGETGVGEKR